MSCTQVLVRVVEWMGVQAEPGADPVGVGVGLSTDEEWCICIRIFVEEILVRPWVLGAQLIENFK